MALSGVVVPIGPTSGGKVYAFNDVITTPGSVAPANPFRVAITFDNPGPVDIVVFPFRVQFLNTITSTPTNIVLTPTTATLGGGYRIYANGGFRTFVGECQGAWQALAVSGTGQLTVTDSNV